MAKSKRITLEDLAKLVTDLYTRMALLEGKVQEIYPDLSPAQFGPAAVTEHFNASPDCKKCQARANGKKEPKKHAKNCPNRRPAYNGESAYLEDAAAAMDERDEHNAEVIARSLAGEPQDPYPGVPEGGKLCAEPDCPAPGCASCCDHRRANGIDPCPDCQQLVDAEGNALPEIGIPNVEAIVYAAQQRTAADKIAAGKCPFPGCILDEHEDGEHQLAEGDFKF